MCNYTIQSWDCKLERAAAALAAGCKVVPGMSQKGTNVYFYNGTAAVSY